MIYEDKYIKSEGYRICFTTFYKNEEVKEKEKNKPCIIFLPGTMSNPFTYWDFIEEMVKYEIVVVGIHFIGHGKSSREKVDFNIDNLKQNVRDVTKYIRENLKDFGNKIILFGHSQGGILASSLIGEDLGVDTYILGNLIISDQKSLKNIIGLKNVPNIFVPIIKVFIKIYGKLFRYKQVKFYDYVKNADKEEILKDEEKYKYDPLRINSYPMSMVTSLITIDTKNLTKPKNKIKENIIVILAKDDPIFPLYIEKEAFDLINAENKKMLIYDSPHHMMYTEHPKDLAKLIYENINKS